MLNHVQVDVRVMGSWWGLKMGMDFWGQVWKRVWEMAFLGLKLGLDLEMRAAHPYQKFQRVAPPPPSGLVLVVEAFKSENNSVKEFKHDFSSQCLCISHQCHYDSLLFKWSPTRISAQGLWKVSWIGVWRSCILVHSLMLVLPRGS